MAGLTAEEASAIARDAAEAYRKLREKLNALTPRIPLGVPHGANTPRLLAPGVETTIDIVEHAKAR